jgi:penicillin-binding protein 1A
MPRPKTSNRSRKHSVSRRKSKRPSRSKKQSIKERVLKFSFKIAAFAVFLVACFFILVYIGAFGQIPSTTELKKINNPVASEVISSDGKLLGRYYYQNRSNVKFEEISPNIINALVATEDARFYKHRGIDEIALLRVLVKTIFLRNRSAGGGSTLSQQIAKNIFGRKNYGALTMPVSKLREAIIAYRLEIIYSKNEILTLYLNTVPFSENTYGIETAAERFFSKPPLELTVPEAATLIGLLKANTAYNPRTNPERSLKRRNTVINQMVKYKFITQQNCDKYKTEPLNLKYIYLVYNTGPAAYFREILRNDLEEWCKSIKKPDGSKYNLYTDGLRIITTIDSRMQSYAEASIKEHMKQLQNTFNKHWKGRNPWGKNSDVLTRAVKRSDRYKNLTKSGKTEEEIEKIFNTPVKVKIFTWDNAKNIKISPLDSVKHSLKQLHSGFIAMNPHNGDIKSWVGGNDFRFFQYDHVKAGRPVGSVFKPIVYASALENGIMPDKYFLNEKVTYKEYQNWTPANSDDEYGGYYSMEGALCNSLNTISVKVLLESGIPNTIRLAESMGISVELPEYPSLALGVSDIPLLQLATAYSCFPTGGKIVKPNYLLRIEDSEGNILKQFRKENKYALSEKTAQIMTHYLQSVVNNGTGKRIRYKYGIKGDFAGKTGTTQNHSDGWFIGFTPDLVTGCWVGAEDPAIHFRTITYGQGAHMALPVVGKFYHKLYNDPEFKKWQYHQFNEPENDLLAMLDIPLRKEEIVEEKRRFIDFKSIFGRKRENKLEERATEEREQTNKEKRREKRKEKPSIWQKIKKALSD